MLNIIIYDNDREQCALLRKRINNVKKVGAYKSIDISSREQLDFHISEATFSPDLAFISTECSAQYGVDIAKELQALYPSIQIVFVCDTNDYIKDLYLVNYIFRLQKPVTDDDLVLVFEKALTNFKETESSVLSFKNGATCYKIPLASVLYLEKNYRKINVVTDNREYSFYGKFEDIEPSLSESFVRCHNGYIVNIEKVIYMSNHKFGFSDRRGPSVDSLIEVPISRSYYDLAKKLFDKK